jgi:hypothetical protein
MVESAGNEEDILEKERSADGEKDILRAFGKAAKTEEQRARLARLIG